MKVLVTGAGGFTGKRVCQGLQAREHQVIAAVRKNGPGLANLNTVVLADFSHVKDWTPVLTGCDAVVHLAGRAHVMQDDPTKSEQLYEEGNVGVLTGLAEASRKAGVRRFVFVSSIKVNGEETAKDKPFTASDTPNPQDAYGRTKLKAENRLREIASESGVAKPMMEWVIVRPPLLYGRNVRGNIARLIRFVERGVPLPFGSIDNARDLLNVDALADLLAITVTHPNAANRIFLACDGSPLSTPDLIKDLAEAANRSARLLPCPPRALDWAGTVMGMESEMRRLTRDLRIDDRETRELLGWNPKYSRQETFREMVEAQRLRSQPDSSAHQDGA